MWRRSSSVGRPAQCRSSTTNSTGRSALHRDEPLDHGVEQPVALGLGIGAGRRRKVGDERRDLGQQAHELAAVPTEEARERAGIDVVDREPERFDERLVRHAELLLAPSEQHDCPVVMHLARELRGETASCRCRARPRRARARAWGSGPVTIFHADGQLLERLGSPDERERLDGAEGRRKRHAAVELDGGDAGSQSTTHASTGSDRPFNVNGPTGLELMAAAGAREHPHERCDQDLAALGRTHSRAASTTGVPNRSSPSALASPALMPTRSTIGRVGRPPAGSRPPRRSRRPRRRNAAMWPSPRPFTSTPWCVRLPPATAQSMPPKSTSASSSPSLRAHLGRPDDVGEQDRPGAALDHAGGAA